MTSNESVIVARIARAHGIHGGLLLDVETDYAEALFRPGQRLHVVGEAHQLGEVTLTEARPHSGRWLVHMQDIPDRTAAEALRGASLGIPRSDLPDLPADGYLLNDLIGMTVVEGDHSFGTITDVYDFPSGPMLAVDIEGQERLIPFQPEIVDSVETAAEKVNVTLPKGLLDV